MLYHKYVQTREKSKELVLWFVTGPLAWWPVEIQDVGDTAWISVASLFHQDVTF